MLNELIENNMILVLPNNMKENVIKEVSSLDKIYNIKFMSLKELIDFLTFTYDERSIYYLIKKYDMNYDVANIYLSNLKYAVNNVSDKTNKLTKIKNELIENNLLIYDKNIDKLKDNKKIKIYGYDYISKFDLDILKKKGINAQIINKNILDFNHDVYEFDDIKDEIYFILSKIIDLLNNGVDINNIKLCNVTSEYENDIKRMFKMFNISLNIKDNKSLGQNFLINSEVVEKIIESSEISDKDMVIEIGPGLGTLTKYLLEKARKVLCVELDSKMIRILQERFSKYENFELINADILKVDLNEIICENKRTGKIKDVKVVANLPYYITTPIIMKLLEEKLDIQSITVMIQKEVADRLIEIPGGKNTGAITHTVYYYCESEKIMEVPNSSFIPEPEVTSEVIKLKLRDKPAVEIEKPKAMFMIIKSAFMQRRKTLLNALTNTKVFLNKEEGLKILKKVKLNENVRAEELSIQDFANIAKSIVR